MARKSVVIEFSVDEEVDRCSCAGCENFRTIIRNLTHKELNPPEERLMVMLRAHLTDPLIDALGSKLEENDFECYQYEPKEHHRITIHMLNFEGLKQVQS